MANTILDELIADLLGDVGKLHAEVKALDERLPAFIEQAESQLSGQVGAIVTASKESHAQLAKFTQAAMDAIEKHAQAKGLQIGQWSSEEREKVRQAMRDYAGEAMAEAVDDIKKAAGVLKDERKDARSRVIIAAVIAGLLAGVVGAGGVLWMDKDREAAAEFGKTAWRVLDEKTRQKVQAAQQGQ